jgi:hypothetical protein
MEERIESQSFCYIHSKSTLAHGVERLVLLETHVSFDHPIHANEYIKNIFIACDLNHDPYLDL